MKGYWYLVAFSAGSTLFAIHYSFFPLSLLILIWIWFLYRKSRIPVFCFGLSLALSFLLVITSTVYTQLLPLPVSNKEILTGKITSAVDRTTNRVEFILTTKAEKRKVLVQFYMDEEKGFTIPETWKRGSVCTLQGSVEIPPGATNPGEFDYKNYLNQKRIYNSMVINDMNENSCSGRSWLSYLDDVRSGFLEKAAYELKPDTAAWTGALLFGEKSNLTKEETELFKEWGLTHLLAISGLHLGMLAAIFYFFLVKSNVLTKEKAGAVLVVFFPCYIVIAGGSPSILRAALMGMFALIIGRMNKRFPSSDILSMVFLLSVIISPSIITQLGFQFSFLVAFSLVLSKKLLQNISSYPFIALSISLISQLVILPIQVDQFYLLNPLSPLVNLVFVPYFSFFVLPMVLAVFSSLYLFPFLSSLLEAVFLDIHSSALSLLKAISSLYYPWVIGEIPMVFFLIYFLLFCRFMGGWNRGKNQKALWSAAGMVLLLAAVSIKPYISAHGIITILDVGQGDAIVIELPYRKGVLLIDVGGTLGDDFTSSSDKTYQQVVKPFLLSKGISDINGIILTHPDLDHTGNFIYLKEDFHIERIFVSRWFKTDAANLKQLGIDEAAELEILDSQFRYEINGHYFDVLSPDRNMGDTNENSLVIFTEFGRKKWLFAGDIEEKAEKEMLNSLLPDIDIIKIAHHGSKTSTSEPFLKKLDPETALISAGRKNRFGHPANETIKKLNENNINIMRTDQNGALQFFYTKEGGYFTTFVKN